MTWLRTFHVASLYPLLYRMEERRWVTGRWVEKAGKRRRGFYRIAAKERSVFGAPRRSWREFVTAIGSVAGVRYA